MSDKTVTFVHERTPTSTELYGREIGVKERAQKLAESQESRFRMSTKTERLRARTSAFDSLFKWLASGMILYLLGFIILGPKLLPTLLSFIYGTDPWVLIGLIVIVILLLKPRR